jgi:hypothetical protein
LELKVELDDVEVIVEVELSEDVDDELLVVVLRDDVVEEEDIDELCDEEEVDVVVGENDVFELLDLEVESDGEDILEEDEDDDSREERDVEDNDTDEEEDVEDAVDELVTTVFRLGIKNNQLVDAPISMTIISPITDNIVVFDAMFLTIRPEPFSSKHDSKTPCRFQERFVLLREGSLHDLLLLDSFQRTVKFRLLFLARFDDSFNYY